MKLVILTLVFALAACGSRPPEPQTYLSVDAVDMMQLTKTATFTPAADGTYVKHTTFVAKVDPRPTILSCGGGICSSNVGDSDGKDVPKFWSSPPEPTAFDAIRDFVAYEQEKNPKWAAR